MQLRDWLDLSLNHSVPSSLLILSRYLSLSLKFSTCRLVYTCTYYAFSGLFNLQLISFVHFWAHMTCFFFACEQIFHCFWKVEARGGCWSYTVFTTRWGCGHWAWLPCHLKILYRKGGGNWNFLKCKRSLSRLMSSFILVKWTVFLCLFFSTPSPLLRCSGWIFFCSLNRGSYFLTMVSIRKWICLLRHMYYIFIHQVV